MRPLFASTLAFLACSTIAAAALPTEEHGRIVALTPTRIAIDTGFNCTRTTTPAVGHYEVGDYARVDCVNGALANVHRHTVIVDARTAKVDRRFPDIGNLSSAVADGHGGWYVGLSQGPQGTAAVGRIRADGTLDTSWLVELPGASVVPALARTKTTLFAAGGAVIHPSRVYAFDLRTRSELWRSPGFHGDIGVHELAATTGALFAAGGFTKVGSATRTDVAALDPRTGHVLRWHTIPKFGEFADVEAIAVSRTRVYVGGPSLLAALDARTGRLTSFRPHVPAADITSIALSGHRVFVGASSHSGAFDAVTGERVRTFAGSIVAVAGSRTYIGGTNVLTAPHWSPDVANNIGVQFLVPSGASVLVGGDFDEARLGS